MFHLLHLKARFSILEFRAVNWQRIMEFVLQSFIGASYFALTTFLIPLIDQQFENSAAQKFPPFESFHLREFFGLCEYDWKAIQIEFGGGVEDRRAWRYAKNRAIKWRAWTVSSARNRGRGKEKGKKTKRGKEKEREVSRSEENKIATRNEAVVALKISTILFLDRLVQHGENFIVRSPVSFQGTVQVS